MDECLSYNDRMLFFSYKINNFASGANKILQIDKNLNAMYYCMNQPLLHGCHGAKETL